MKVKTIISKGDYWRAFKFAAMRIDSYKRALAFMLILIPVIFAMLAFAYSIQYHTTLKFVLTSLIFGIIFDIAVLYLIKWCVIKKLQHEKAGAAGERVIEIDEKGVTVTAQGLNGSISWGLAQSLDADKKCIYIFISALDAIIVPKKAFENLKDAGEFFNKCAEYLKAAGGAKSVQ